MSRPSASANQDTSVQEATLKAAGCDIIRTEKRSGTTLQGRPELQAILDFVRKGDTAGSHKSVVDAPDRHPGRS